MDNRPIVLYDADCGFCRWALARLLAWDRRRLRTLPIGSAEGQRRLAGLRSEEREASWHFVGRNGNRRSGGQAAASLLRELPGGRPLAAIAERLPGPTEAAYRWVADHRPAFGRLISAGAIRRADARISSRR